VHICHASDDYCWFPYRYGDIQGKLAETMDKLVQKCSEVMGCSVAGAEHQFANMIAEMKALAAGTDPCVFYHW
jgi:hypothetical protein